MNITGYERRYYEDVAQIRRLLGEKAVPALERIAQALEGGAAPDAPNRLHVPLDTLDRSVILTALEQHRLHVEEEAEATSDEGVAAGLRERIRMLDAIARKLGAD